MKEVWQREEYREKMREKHRGKKGYWAGKKLSEEHKKKLSDAHKDQKPFWKGKKLSEEHKKKLSESHLGQRAWNKGKETPKESRIRMSYAHKKTAKRGVDHHNWRGGVTSKNAKIRNSLEYRLWRVAVFGRDKWTCVWCGVVGGELHADHIKPFAHYPELRFAIDNGRTMCVPCHKTTDTYLAKARYKKI